MPDRIRPDVLVDELVRTYSRAHQRLEQLVRDAIAGGNLGSEAYRRRQLQSVAAILSNLRRHGTERGDVLVRSAYSSAAVAVDELTGLAADFGGVHERAVRVLAANLTTPLDQAATLVGRRTEGAFRRVALERISVAVAAGDTRREASAALRRGLVDERVTDALTGFVDASGRRWGLAHYTQMIARTTTREAVSAGTAVRLTEHGLDLVTISSHNTETPLCQEFEGKTFSLSGRTPGHPVLRRRPPFHPNCRHVMTPAGASFDDFERALLGQPKPPRTPRRRAPRAPAPNPSGSAIADALNPTPPVRALTGHVSDAIARVHSVPDAIAPVPVRGRRARNGQLAAYVRSVAGQPIQVEVDSSQPAAASHLAHELGHYVDHQALPGDGMSSESASELEPFRQAVAQSAAVQRLERMQRGLDTVRTTSGTDRAPGPRFVEYLLRRREIFARAYRQWIAIRSGDSRLVDELREEQRVVVDQGVGYPDVWSDEDFEPVAQALDEVFRRAGLR